MHYSTVADKKFVRWNFILNLCYYLMKCSQRNNFVFCFLFPFTLRNLTLIGKNFFANISMHFYAIHCTPCCLYNFSWSFFSGTLNWQRYNVVYMLAMRKLGISFANKVVGIFTPKFNSLWRKPLRVRDFFSYFHVCFFVDSTAHHRERL